MKHSGGLDGLRGVAVLVVVLFHAQVPGAGGGFLGVSLFFTLSGFLITSLLLAEFEVSGSIALRQFYVRRARRLLPAAYLCLVSVALAGAWWSAGQRAQLPGDLIASVANVANWRFAFAPTNYADLFVDAPSPVAHFWSLAIEEQIYLVLPVVVIVALRRSRRTLAWVIAVLLSASTAATLLTSDRDLVYNATHTRAAELLVGVALALLSRRGDRSVGDRLWRRLGWLPGAVAGAALVALVALASLDQAWIYRGGLVAVAVLSAVLIAAVVSEQFPNRLLDVRPLVTLGRLSYGIYLAHWPIFLLLDAERTGLGPVALFVVRCVATGAVAVASASLLEEPVRRGRIPKTTPAFVVASGVGVLAVLFAALVVIPQPEYTPTEELLSRGDTGVVDFGATESTTPRPEASRASPMNAAVGPSKPFRVAVIGSEPTAVAALAGAATIDGPDLVVEVRSDIRPECPLSTTVIAGCPTPAERLRALQALGEVDAVVIAVGPVEDLDVESRVAAVGSRSALAEFGASQLAAATALQALVDDAVAADVDVVLYSAGKRFADFDRLLAELAYAEPSIRAVIRTATDLASTVRVRAQADQRSSIGAMVSQQALRLLVIGDSTSLTLAMALSDASDGRLDVLWAGANGCPVAPVEATRTSPDEQWTMASCEPYETKLPPLIASFAPQVVLVVSGPIELAEHRFAGDPAARVAGDAEFMSARDAAFESLGEMTYGDIPILVSDMPAVRTGPFSSPEMTSPARLDALNEQIDDWARTSSQVAHFAYRDTLESAESTPGALRSDGVHPDAGPLQELARSVYVDRVVELSGMVRAELDAAKALNG